MKTKKSKQFVFLVLLASAFLPALSFSQDDSLTIYLSLLQDQKFQEASAVQGISPFLKNYRQFLDSGSFSASAQEDQLISSLIALCYQPEKLKLPALDAITQDREKAFYYLAAAVQTSQKKEIGYGLRFYFQSFYLFSSWKNRYPLADRIVFMNEWFYHFSRDLLLFKPVPAGQEEYLVSLLLNSSDLAYHVPYAYFLHPRMGVAFVTNFLFQAGDLIMGLDQSFRLSSSPRLRFPVFKMYLVNGVSLFMDRNYLKSDLYFAKLLSYFESFPVSEDLFMIYEEALKNRILVLSKLSLIDETGKILKKYLDYSKTTQRLAENWQNLKEAVDSDQKIKEIFTRLEIRKILTEYHLI